MDNLIHPALPLYYPLFLLPTDIGIISHLYAFNATSLPTCFQTVTIVSSASSNNRINRIKPPAASASGKWWTPLFGWSSDPDYIQNPAIATEGSVTGSSDPDNGRSRFAPGCFTEEKAKQLRMKTIEMANFHDIMYHSAIASRLASDVSGRYDR